MIFLSNFEVAVKMYAKSYKLGIRLKEASARVYIILYIHVQTI